MLLYGVMPNLRKKEKQGKLHASLFLSGLLNFCNRSSVLFECRLSRFKILPDSKGVE